jgi:sarcosine oxidase
VSEAFDVIIVGLGAMGSAAAYHLAKRGRRVLGIDRFHPPHNLGSSHGGTRIIREAYMEDPSYVPLVQHAYDLWLDLERESGEDLLTRTGGVMIGAPDDAVVTGALASAQQHGLDHELLDRADLHERAPGFALPEDHVAVWEPRAGALDPERCIETHLRLAQQYGATLRYDERVIRWAPDGAGVTITTDHGEYRADRLILSAGAWTADFHEKLNLPLRVTRQVVYWFEPTRNPEHFRPDRFPVFVWHLPDDIAIYGFPNFGGGVKAGVHNPVVDADPDAIDRDVGPDEIEAMRQRFATYLPDAAGTFRKAEVCMYTNTPDGHFLLDFHHRHPQVIVASPCSGHGFKFASAIGEVLADMALDEISSFDLGLFGLSRLLPSHA